MQRRRTLLVGVVVCGLGLAAGLVWAGTRPRRRIFMHPTSSMAIAARPVVDGLGIAFSAQAQVFHPFRDPVIWWTAEVRGSDDQTVLWSHSWDQPGFLVQGRRKRFTPMTVPEVRVPVPTTGYYRVILSVWSDDSSMTREGEILETSMCMITRSAFVNVP